MMTCPACGRRMLDRGTHFECPNILCDYEEDVKEVEGMARAREKSQGIVFSKCDDLRKQAQTYLLCPYLREAVFKQSELGRQRGSH